jgi:hypothetical protein
MKSLSAGRALVTLVSIWAAFGSYAFDWNATHIFNPEWPPHAKFHNAQTMLLGTALGLLALHTLWRAVGDATLRLRFATAAASFYWLTQIGALFFPGTALFDPNQRHPGQLPEQLIVDAVMLSLLSLGYALESRRLRFARPPRTGAAEQLV